MFVTGPDVVKTVTKEVVTKEELGAHRAFANDIEAISSTRALMQFLPQSCREPRPHKAWTDWDRKQQSSC
jgi:propionyl-CoA carboxylase beta chain